MTVRELMPRFLALGEGHAGCGPNHPDTPAPKLLPQIEAFFAKQPALLRDPSYVEFLQTYAAASLSIPDEDDERWVCFLPGLIEDHWALVPFTTEGYGVDADGFLMVAQLFHQESKDELEFGYYVAGPDRPGLYRIAMRGPIDEVGQRSKELGWYCPSFAEWLQRFVDLGEAIFQE